jgi:hypothetical protein
MLNTVIKLKQMATIMRDSPILPEGRKQKYLKLTPMFLGETTIFRETSSRWK